MRWKVSTLAFLWGFLTDRLDGVSCHRTKETVKELLFLLEVIDPYVILRLLTVSCSGRNILNQEYCGPSSSGPLPS